MLAETGGRATGYTFGDGWKASLAQRRAKADRRELNENVFHKERVDQLMDELDNGDKFRAYGFSSY